MRKSFVWLSVGLLLSLALGLFYLQELFLHKPLIYPPPILLLLNDAVNALRAGHGLPAYQTSSILMATAQAQANYMASIGMWSDYGPGGSTLGERLLAAGYPLAGD